MKVPNHPHRIDSDHILNQAARATNAYAEEHGGISAALDWLGIGTDIDGLGYFAEQRALRAMAARGGYNMTGADPQRDEMIAREIVTSPEWQQLRSLLIGCYMDGITIGMKAEQLKQPFMPLDGDRRAQ